MLNWLHNKNVWSKNKSLPISFRFLMIGSWTKIFRLHEDGAIHLDSFNLGLIFLENFRIEYKMFWLFNSSNENVLVKNLLFFDRQSCIINPTSFVSFSNRFEFCINSVFSVWKVNYDAFLSHVINGRFVLSLLFTVTSEKNGLVFGFMVLTRFVK